MATRSATAAGPGLNQETNEIGVLNHSHLKGTNQVWSTSRSAPSQQSSEAKREEPRDKQPDPHLMTFVIPHGSSPARARESHLRMGGRVSHTPTSEGVKGCVC